MKFLAFILSIYIFVLNIAPCEDYTLLDNEVNTEISQAVGDDHNHLNSDLCSPFCHCQCCQVHAAEFDMVEFAALTNEISSKVFFHINNLGKDIPNSILQPPRV